MRKLKLQEKRCLAQSHTKSRLTQEPGREERKGRRDGRKREGRESEDSGAQAGICRGGMMPKPLCLAFLCLQARRLGSRGPMYLLPGWASAPAAVHACPLVATSGNASPRHPPPHYPSSLKIYLFIYFLERGEGREKERRRNINAREKQGSAVSCTSPNRDQTCNLGMCPDWESNG